MADTGSSEDREVLELSAADSGAVARNEEQLGVSGSHRAHGVLVT